MNKFVVNVRNAAQQVLLRDELQGQISDGMWENTVPHNHWIPWCEADVRVDPTNVGRNFYARKDNYRLDNKDLLEVVGDRMLESVRALPGYEAYSMKDMRADLQDLRTIFKTHRRATVAEVAEGEAEREAAELQRRKVRRQQEELVERLNAVTGKSYSAYVDGGRFKVSYEVLEQLVSIAEAARTPVG